MKTPCRKAFTETILELAREDKDIVVLTSDARGSVTLNDYADELPDQFVELGIAEQNMVGTAAGIALSGLKPFVCGPACFLSARSFEQVKVDMAYAGTNVKAIGVSGGVSYGALGTSHHSVQDIAMMRATAGITIILPSDARQTREMTRQLANFEGPVYVRMGRGGVEDVYESDDVPFEIGKANTVHEGDDIAIIGCGETVRIALDAAIELKKQGIDARVIDMHTIKPLDTDVILKAAKETGRIITIEEHCVNGGLGGAVAEVLSQNIPTPLKIMGIPDEQTVTGNSPEVFKHYGLTAENVVKIAKEMVEK
jgi:transketolase